MPEHDDDHDDHDHHDQPAGPTTRRRTSHLRTGRRLLFGPLVLMGAVFAVTSHAVGIEQADVSGAQKIDYYEECNKEGCSNEEIKELWSSYQSECFSEYCWTEEVFELSGGPHYLTDPKRGWTSDGKGGLVRTGSPDPSRIPEMFQAFKNRLGKNFTPAPMYPGSTGVPPCGIYGCGPTPW